MLGMPSWFSREFNDKCAKLGIEPVMSRDGSAVRFVCPKLPDKKIQDEVLKDVPSEIKSEWKEDMKSSTEGSIQIICEQLRSVGVLKKITVDRPAPHKLKLVLEGREDVLAKDGPAIETIEEILKLDAYVDCFEIIVNEEKVGSFNRSISTALANRGAPDRGKITEDDSVNLKILLETCSSVDDFIKNM